MSGVMLEEAETTEAVQSLYKRCAQRSPRVPRALQPAIFKTGGVETRAVSIVQ